MTTKRARSPKVADVAAVAVVLVAAGILLWPRGGADRESPAPGMIAPQRTLPALPAAAPPAAAASPAAASAPALAPFAVAPASSPPSDPFKAFLEAHREGAASAASQPALPAPVDPFKAAMEAGRRPEPVPLVSPFGAPKQ
jgi:hypothetical protein